MRVLTLIIILFSFSHGSRADYTEACFEDNQTAGNALRSMEFLKTNSDKILLVGGCIKIETSSARLNLFQKYLRQKFSVSFMNLSTSVPTKNCNIEIRKVINTKTDSTSIENKKFNLANKKSNLVSTSKLVLAEGLKSKIRYLDQTYNIICFHKGNGYDIKLESTSPNIGLKTSRFIKSGEEVELGDILSQTNDQDNAIDSSSGIRIKRSQTNKSEKIYLSIK